MSTTKRILPPVILWLLALGSIGGLTAVGIKLSNWPKLQTNITADLQANHKRQVPFMIAAVLLALGALLFASTAIFTTIRAVRGA